MLLVAASPYIWPLLSPASTQEELPRKGSERLADAARIVTGVSRGSSTGTETPWYCQFQTIHYTKDSLVFSVRSEPTRHFRGYIEYHCTSTSVTETSAAISVNTLPPYAHQLKSINTIVCPSSLPILLHIFRPIGEPIPIKVITSYRSGYDNWLNNLPRMQHEAIAAAAYHFTCRV
jgi:hypothetical protein